MGDLFVQSEHASVLRTALWTRNIESWPQLHGKPFFHDEDPVFNRILNWRDCHAVALMASGDSLGLSVNYYGRHCATIVLSPERALWQRWSAAPNHVWLIAPGLRRFAGPLPLEQYLVERDPNRPKQALAVLDAALDACGLPPPFHLTAPSSATVAESPEA